MKRRPPRSSWELRPRDRPSAWLVRVEPRLRGIEENPVYRRLRGMRVRIVTPLFAFLSGGELHDLVLAGVTPRQLAEGIWATTILGRSVALRVFVVGTLAVFSGGVAWWMATLLAPLDQIVLLPDGTANASILGQGTRPVQAERIFQLVGMMAVFPAFFGFLAGNVSFLSLRAVQAAVQTRSRILSLIAKAFPAHNWWKGPAVMLAFMFLVYAWLLLPASLAFILWDLARRLLAPADRLLVLEWAIVAAFPAGYLLGASGPLLGFACRGLCLQHLEDSATELLECYPELVDHGIVPENDRSRKPK